MVTEIMGSLQELNILEAIATLSFILYVILAARENPLCWPISMIGVAIMCYISFHARLYADIILNGFYFVISVYGFHNWMRGGTAKNELPVSTSSKVEVLWLSVISLVGIIAMGLALDHFTDTDVAYWDATTTVLSFAGTWMLAKKKIGNWIIWIIVDSIYIWLYFYKQLPLLSMLNVFYVIISFYGLYSWRKSMKIQLRST